ncbi:MAG: CpsD/CapB family tyrosine-protein kinase [Pseudomonadota bacterium]
MEHLKTALDKARTKRESVSEGRGKHGQRRQLVNHTGSSEASGINYTETAVVDLDESVLEANRIITHDKTDPRGACFDILRTKVLKNMARMGAKTLAITSATPENGKSVIAINLAFSIAQLSELSVLLVDFDLRRPAIGQYLGIKRDVSFFDHLHGEVPLEATMINPGRPRIVVIPNQKPVINASETLASQHVLDLVAELKRRYPDRIVIFDLPPLLGIDDALVVLPHIDASLLVVGSDICKTGELEESRRLLADHNLIGVVLNKSGAQPADYY